jgi:hypothetical protein
MGDTNKYASTVPTKEIAMNSARRSLSPAAAERLASVTMKHSVWKKKFRVTGIIVRKGGKTIVQCVNLITDRPFTLRQVSKQEIVEKLDQTNDTMPRPQLRTKHGVAAKIHTIPGNPIAAKKKVLAES